MVLYMHDPYSCQCARKCYSLLNQLVIERKLSKEVNLVLEIVSTQIKYLSLIKWLLL